MSKETRVAVLIFALASAGLWGLAAYLLGSAGGTGNSRVFGLAAGWAALILTLHTVLYAMFGDRKRRQGEWFRRHGKPVEAKVVKLGRRGHRSAWRVKARHVDPESGVETFFKSDILRANPGKRFRVGDSVTVYLHPADERRYWMDVGMPSKNL